MAQQSQFNIVNCNFSSVGNLVRGISVDDAEETEIYPKQNIQVNVTAVGSYSIITNTVNGIYFSASGNFNAVGLQIVELKSKGIPINYGEFTYALGDCDFKRYTYIPDKRYKDTTIQGQDSLGVGGITARHHRFLYKAFESIVTGEEWMNSNLGANYNKVGHPSFNPDAIPNAINDINAFGSSYQWGRYSDGHELINWTSNSDTSNQSVNGHTLIKSATNDPGHNKMIIQPQWQVTPNDNLWQGESGQNNPCAVGFRVPLQIEFSRESNANNIKNINDAYASQFRIVAPGARQTSGNFESAPGYQAVYWTSSKPSGNTAGTSHDYHFQATAYEHSTTRGFGFSVRCILLSYLYKVCDYDYDGQEDFDLDNIATQIKQDYPGYKVTFYTSFFNAQVGTGLGLLTGNFTATTVQNPNIIFARLEDPSGKFIDGVKIKLMVYKVPQAENFKTIYYCTTIGSSIGAFNLKSIESGVENNADFTFKYYTKETSANAGGTTDIIALPASYTGPAGKVYVRIENTEGCFIVREIPVAISSMTLASQTINVNPFCATEKLDLTSYISQLSNNDPDRYQFYFYTDQTSANANTIANAIQDPENFDLTGLGDFSIWVNISLNGGINCAKIVSKLNFSVIAIPDIKIKTILPICEGNSINLEAETSVGNIVNWYDSETATTPIFTGDSFITLALTANTTYWLESINSNNCKSPRISVEVKVNPLPVFGIPTGILICENTTTLLEVTTASTNVVNWFDSPTSMTPIFTGNQYQTSAIPSNTSFWIEVTNPESCISERTEILVETKPETKPEFTIQTQFCENSTPINLPLISDNGISGTWDISTVDTSTVGKQIYTFTPDSGQCASPFNIEIEVTAKLVPEFAIVNQYCENSSSVTLPTTSDNGIIGTWNLSNIDTSTIGIKTYTFTPNDSCAETFDINIEIVSKLKPQFSFVTQFCQNSTSVLLPTTSDNGIIGTWNLSNIDTSAIGIKTYTFTPNDSCAETFNINVEIVSKLKPQFSVITQYCQNSTLVSLPTISDDGIVGVWNLSNIDTSTIGIKTYTFTPNDSCAETFDINIEIVSKLTPQFSFAAQFCQNSTSVLLPTTSDNGIMGTWNLSNIDTSTIGIKTYTFTPNNSCAEIFNINIEIVSKLKPQFSFASQFCQNSTSISLPKTSDNGIIGTWDISNIDTSTIGIKTYTFTPNDSCAETFTINIEIVSKLKPQFNFVTQYCQNSTLVLLPTTSDNGIVGAWNVSNVDTSTIGIKTYTFTPNDSCAEKISIQIEIISAPVITNVEINGTDIIVSANGNSLEYSLDGIIWQNSNVFINVNIGTYEVYVKNNIGCISIYRTVSILKFNNFISPNGDGSNDFWEIKGLPANSKFRIQILNKYGITLIDKNAENDFKWDGKENGKPLQTDSYWYVITLQSGQVFSGYILLKNF